MKKTIIYFVLGLFVLKANAQTQAIRDSIVGKYFCNVTFIANGNTSYYTDTLNPYIDPSDSIAFYIDDGQFCCWLAHMVLNNDSDFAATNVISDGTFYAPDSLYYYYNCLSPLGCVYLFYCNKLSTYTGINENPFLQNSIIIKPNPANNKLIISSEILLGNIKIQLQNALGATVFEKKSQNLNSAVALDISKIPNGIYFLSLNQEEQTKVYKIIIQH